MARLLTLDSRLTHDGMNQCNLFINVTYLSLQILQPQSNKSTIQFSFNNEHIFLGNHSKYHLLWTLKKIETSLYPIFKTVCQNKSLSPMSLYLAINQHFVILYLSKHIYMCTMNKFAKTNQTKHGNISICSVWYFKIIDIYISAFRFNKPLSQIPFHHNYKSFKFQKS